MCAERLPDGTRCQRAPVASRDGRTLHNYCEAHEREALRQMFAAALLRQAFGQ